MSADTPRLALTQLKGTSLSSSLRYNQTAHLHAALSFSSKEEAKHDVR